MQKVLGAAGVEGVLRHSLDARPETLRVDLIAHSRARRLHLGDWTVDDNAPTEELRQNLAQALNGVALEIRLLGCNTGIMPDGRNAMRAIARSFGARVWGTMVPVSANDFADNEFKSTGILVDQDGAPHFPPSPIQGTVGWFTTIAKLPSGSTHAVLLGALSAESEDQLCDDWNRTHPSLRWPIHACSGAALRALVQAHAEPAIARIAGLLALPELEIAAPMTGGGFERLTVLLDGEFVRVYPQNVPEGATLKMKLTPAYSAALAALAAGPVIRS
ncbi:MAG TPA: hypothetical protein VGD80_12545 [Kofleriaceae bacterium]